MNLKFFKTVKYTFIKLTNLQGKLNTETYVNRVFNLYSQYSYSLNCFLR